MLSSHNQIFVLKDKFHPTLCSAQATCSCVWTERHLLNIPLCTLLGILFVNMLSGVHQCEYTGKKIILKLSGIDINFTFLSRASRPHSSC